MADNTNTKIEREIVKMEFDGRNFEKNVQESIETIKLLNAEILDLSKASLSFQKLEDASKNIKLDGISKSVDDINERFSLMGNIVQRVYRDIADSTVNLVKKMSTNFISVANPFGIFDTGNMRIGLKKYEDYNNAIRTMYNNLSADARYSYMEQEELMDHIEKSMDYITTYSDETNAAIDKVVDAVSKLTNAGEDLEDAQRHVVGYTNMLGSAGFSVEEINNMYGILDSITSSGRIMTRQYMMIAKTFTPQVRKLLMEYAAQEGALKDIGNGNYLTNLPGKKETLVTAGQEFRASLQQGWLTSDIYERVLDDYAAYYDAVKKLADDMGTDYTTAYNDFTSAAQAGGDVLRNLYLELGYTNEYFDENIATLQEWQKAALDSTRQAKTFGDAINTAIGQIQVGWKNTFTIIFGNVMEAERLWTDLANGLYGFFAAIARWRNNFLREFKSLGGIQNIIEGITNVLNNFAATDDDGNIVGIIGAFVKGIREAFGKYLNPESLAAVSRGFLEMTQKLMADEHILNSITQIVKLISSLVAFVFRLVGKVVEIISPLAAALSDILYFVTNIVGSVAEFINMGLDIIIDNVINNLLNLKIVEGILSFIENLLNDILKASIELLNSIKKSGVGLFLQKIYNGTRVFVDGVFSIFVKNVNDLVDNLKKLYINAKKIFSLNFKKIKDIISNIMRNLEKLFTYIERLRIMDKIFNTINLALMLLAATITMIFKIIHNVITFIIEKLPNANNIFNKFKDKINEISEKAKKLEFIKNIGERIHNVWSGLIGIFDKIKASIENLNIDKTFDKIYNFLEKINNIWYDYKSGKINFSEFFTRITNEFSNALYKFISNITTTIIDGAKAIDLDKILMAVLSSIPVVLVSLGKVIYKLIGNLFNYISSAFNNDKTIQEQIIPFTQNIINVIFTALNNVADFILSIPQKWEALKEKVFSKIDLTIPESFIARLKEIIDRLLVLFMMLVTVVKTWVVLKLGKQIGEAFSGLIKSWTDISTSIATAIRQFGNTINDSITRVTRAYAQSKSWKAFTAMLLSIAILIAEIVGIVYLLNQYFTKGGNMNSLLLAASIVVGGLILLVSMFTLFFKVVGDAISSMNVDTLKAFAKILTGMAALFLLPVLSVFIIANIDFSKIIDKLEIFSSFIIYLYGTMVLLSTISGLIDNIANKGKGQGSISSMLQNVGNIFLGIAAFITSMFLLQFVDLDKIMGPLLKLVATVIGIVAVVGVIQLLLSTLSRLLKVTNKSLTQTQGSFTEIIKSLATIAKSFSIAMYTLWLMDDKKMDKVSEILQSIMGTLAIVAILFATASVITASTKGGADSLKMLLSGLKIVIGEVSLILLIFTAMDQSKIQTATVALNSIMIFVGVLALMIAGAVSLLNKGRSIGTKISEIGTMKTMFIMLLIGIAAILAEVSIMLGIVSMMDTQKIQTATLAISSILLMVSLLALGLAGAMKTMPKSKDIVFTSIGIFLGSLLIILAEVSAFLLALQAMELSQIEASIPLLITVFAGVAGLALVLANITKFLPKGIEISTMGVFLIGLGGILLEIAGFLYILKSMELAQMEASIPLLITVFSGVGLLALALTGMSYLIGTNITGIGASIIALGAVVLSIVTVLNTLNSVKDILNTETINAFKNVLISLGAAFAVLIGLSAILAGISMSGVGSIFSLAFMAILFGLSTALIMLSEAFKIFAEGANIFGDATIKFSNAFNIFTEGVNTITNAFTGFLNSIKEFISQMLILLSKIGPAQLLALSGSISALGVGFGVLAGGCGLLALALTPLAGALALFNPPFATFVTTLERVWNLGGEVFQAAMNFISGFTGKIKEGKMDSFQSGKELGEAAVEGLNAGTDSHSPSRLAMQNGEYFVIGMIDGIETYMPVAKEKAESLGLNVVEGLENAVDLSYEQVQQLGYNTADALLDAIQAKIDDTTIPIEIRADLQESKGLFEEQIKQLDEKQKEINEINAKINKNKLSGDEIITLADKDNTYSKAKEFSQKSGYMGSTIKGKASLLSQFRESFSDFTDEEFEKILNGERILKNGNKKYMRQQGGGYYPFAIDADYLYNQLSKEQIAILNNYSEIEAKQAEGVRLTEEATKKTNELTDAQNKIYQDYGLYYNPKDKGIYNEISGFLRKNGMDISQLGFLNGDQLGILKGMMNGGNPLEIFKQAGINTEGLDLGSLIGGYGGSGSEDYSDGRLAATTNLLVEAQENVQKLSDLYKQFGQDESTALASAQADTRSYYKYLYDMYKQADENFDMEEVVVGYTDKGKPKKEKRQISEENAMAKAFQMERKTMIDSTEKQYDAFGFNTVEATKPKTDYATAKKNLKMQTEKINHFVTGFKRLAKAGLSLELANVIQQEGYWNSPTFAMLDNMSDSEIQKYQEAMDSARKAFEEAQQEIATTHQNINISSYSVKAKKENETSMKKQIEDNLNIVKENLKAQGWTAKDIEEEIKKEREAAYKANGLDKDFSVGNQTIKIDTSDATPNLTLSNSSGSVSGINNVNEHIPIEGASSSSSDPNKDERNKIENSSLYNSIRNWVDEADIDTDDKEVKRLMRIAASKNYDTEEKVRDFFESKGYDWMEDELAGDEDEEVHYSKSSKASATDTGTNGSFSPGIIGPNTTHEYHNQGAQLGTSTVQGMNDSFEEKGPEIGQLLGNEIVESSTTLLVSKAPSVVQNVANTTQPIVEQSFVDMLSSLLARSDFLELCAAIGSAISAGIKVGIDSGKDGAVGAAEDVARDSVEAMGPAAGVASPSKITMKVGKYIAEGLALGISQNSFLGTEAAYKMAYDTTNVFSNAFSNINNLVEDALDDEVNLTPIINMDEIMKSADDITKLFNNKDIEMVANAKSNQNKGKNSESDNTNSVNNYTFTQNNYSPKALSRSEIYRQTNNQFSQIKVAVNNKKNN